MVSQEVLETLDELHKELLKLKPAATLLQKANQTVDEVSKLPKIVSDFVGRLQPLIDRFANELAASTEKEIDKLKEKHNKVTVALSEFIGQSSSKLKEDSKEILSTYEAGRKTIQKLSEDEFDRLGKKNKELHGSIEALIASSNGELDRLVELMNQLNVLKQKIEAVDFPTRLDKLDANVAGIMAGIQSTQSRMDNIERNLTDKMRDLTERQREETQSLKNTVESALNRQQIYTFITWGLTIVAIITLIILN